MKYGATRWLSKELCIQRVLQQFPSLRSYFASQNPVKSDLRLLRLQKHFMDPLTEIYLLFYQSVLPLFSEINTFLQFEEPKIHTSRSELVSFIQKLLGRFLLVKAFKNVPIAEVGVQDPDNFLDDNRIMIGFTTRQAFKSNDLLPREEARIVRCCKSFFVMAYEYAVSHISFSDELLKHAEVLQVENREIASFDSKIYFVERFPTLKAKLNGKMDILYDQFNFFCRHTYPVKK